MRQYIKYFTLGILAFSLMSCTAISHLKKRRAITADRAIKECREPIEFYAVPPTSYGVEVRLMRHTGCMGIPDMMMGIWFGERNELTTKLLVLLFIDSLNLQNEKQLGRVFLKIDQVTADDGENTPHIMFFELVEVDPREHRKSE